MCRICNGSGEIPFVNKGGKTIPHTFVFCECWGQQMDHEYLAPVKADDFDFPCSRDWRNFYEEQATGRPLEPIEPTKQASSLTSAPVPRPIVNVTYKVADVQTPAFKSLQEQLQLINGRLTKYFESRAERKKQDDSYEPF